MELRHVGAEVGIALVRADDETAGLRHRKIRACHPGLGTQEIGSRRLPLPLRKIMNVIVAGLRSDRLRKHLGDVATQLMHRWHDDMAWWIVIKLLDALAKVGLYHLYTTPFEEGTHVAFLGQHRFALDERLGPARREDIVDDLVVLGGVAGPVHMRAVLLRARFELLEIVGEMRKHVLFDLGSEGAQLLPFRNAMRLAVPLEPQIPKPPVMEFLVRPGGNEFGGCLRMVDPFHARSPLRICAMWMKRISRPSRSAQPF